jgi:hypothetical protein
LHRWRMRRPALKRPWLELNVGPISERLRGGTVSQVGRVSIGEVFR